MVLTVKIDGVTTQPREGTLAVERRIGERATASFDVPAEASPTLYEKGQPIEVLDGATKVFAGFLEMPNLAPIGPNVGRFTIDAVDNCYLADKRIVAASYVNQTAGFIVRDLKDDFLEPEGVDVSDAQIQDGPTIEQAIFNYVRVSDAIAALAEKANFWWRIDADRVLHFKARTADTAGYTADDTTIRRGSISIEHGNPLYRNRQYVRGGRDTTASQVETRKGDGDTRSWVMGFPIAEVPTVKVNTVTKTVGIKGIDAGKNFYWSKGDAVLAQDLGDAVLISTDTLEVTYKGQFPIVVLSFDEAEIALRKAKEGAIGTGRVDDVFDDANLVDRLAAFELANAKLAIFAVIAKRVTFQTQQVTQAGELLTVNLPNFGINNVTMLVEAVSITAVGDTTWYDVTAAEGPSLGSWVQFFEDMMPLGRRIDLLNIGADTVLTILVGPFNETWAWAEVAPTVSVFACPVPATTLFPETTLLPC